MVDEPVAEPSAPAEAPAHIEAPPVVQETPQETPVESTPTPAAIDQAPATPAEPVPPPEPSPAPEVPEVDASNFPPPTVPSEISEPQVQAVASTQSSPPTPPANPVQQSSTALLPPSDLAARGLASRRARREERLQKVLELVKKEGSVGSMDVQKYLHVSDSSATRYLKELVKQGKLKRVGSVTHAQYTLI